MITESRETRNAVAAGPGRHLRAAGPRQTERGTDQPRQATLNNLSKLAMRRISRTLSFPLINSICFACDP
jgi:hypothetical protein